MVGQICVGYGARVTDRSDTPLRNAGRNIRPPRQHTITEWLLKYHAHHRGGPQLWVYDKATGGIHEQPTSTFMAPRGEHTEEIETRLSKIETPAARAAAEIHRLAEPHDPGFIRIAGWSDADEQIIAPARAGPIISKFKLTVIDAQTKRLDESDRHDLGTFAALMYARAPKVQAAVRDMTTAYIDGMSESMSRLSGPIPRRLVDELAAANERIRWVGLDEAPALGERLAGTQWYILKAADAEGFVLGDSAVTTSLAIGHDDVWRPLFDDATYAVMLPLGPSLTLIMAPKLMVPGAGPTWDPVKTIAMLSWKWAERYVAGRSQADLAAVAASITEAGWGESAPVSADFRAAQQRGVDFVAPYLAGEHRRPRRRTKRRARRPAR